MLFTEAMEEMLKGNYVTRTGWTDMAYVVLFPGMLYLWKIMTMPNPTAGGWVGTVEDLLANDWMVTERATDLTKLFSVKTNEQIDGA